MVDNAPGLGRRVAAGAGWSLGGRLAVAGLGLVASAVLARLLSVAHMGAYLLASSLVTSAAVVAGAGINQVCIRYVAEHFAAGEPGLARHTLQTLLRLGLVVAVGSAIGFAATADFLTGTLFNGVGIPQLGVLLGAWVFMLAAQTMVADGFRGLADIRSASLYGGPLTSALVVCALLAVLATGADLTVTEAVLLALAAAAVNVIPAALALYRRVRRLPWTSPAGLDRLRVPKVLSVSLPLVLTTVLLLVLAAADLWVLGAWWPAADVAAYGVAARTAVLVGMPLLVVYGVLPPFIAGLYASGERGRLERLLQASAMAATVPAGLLTAVFAVAGGPLLSLVYGEHYRSGGFALAILSVGHLLSVVTGVCGLVLAMTGHQDALLRITAVTVFATVGMLVLTVPTWGSHAAALVAAGGLAVQNIGMAVAARRLTGLSTLASPVASARSLREVLG